MADEQNPNPDDPLYISREELELLKSVANAARNVADVNNTMRQTPVNIRNREDLMLHMMTAHEMHPLSLQFYDESEHDQVPALRNRKRNWSGPTVPELDHQDLMNLHHHDHTEGEFASDYPHTTLDSDHFHH